MRPQGRVRLSELHPHRQAEGKPLRFDHAGIQVRVPAYMHSTEDYLEAFRSAGSNCVTFESLEQTQTQSIAPRLLIVEFATKTDASARPFITAKYTFKKVRPQSEVAPRSMPAWRNRSTLGHQTSLYCTGAKCSDSHRPDFSCVRTLGVRHGRFPQSKSDRFKDLIIECVAGLTIPIVIVPSIFFAVPEVLEALMPGSTNAWSSLVPNPDVWHFSYRR